MTSTFDKRLSVLAGLDRATLETTISGGRKGVEKESLRVDTGGHLVLTPHPRSLGSALTNAYITTDFSESLLEFVTPAYQSTWEALRAICDIHQFTYENLGDEMLWAASMPCRLPDDPSIPLARYGDSNVGQMKTIYRRGLGYRYGRHMQTIAGVHFNYSVPEAFWPYYQTMLKDDRDEEAFRSDHYIGLVRNFRRYGWILLYLFGASPALCKSFAGDDSIEMRSLNEETWYEPFGTSLRMSDLGYNNQTQSRINISLNSMDEYIRDLAAATRTSVPAYEKIGVNVDGEFRQLNTNLLQIENEYYSSIRPKRVAKTGERPTTALMRGGVEYVEIRSLDINVFDPCGINQNTMRFIEAFLVYCLLAESPPLDDTVLAESQNNQALTARRGRDPDLILSRNGEAIALVDWAKEIVQKTAAAAELIDRGEKSDSYARAAKLMRGLVDDVERTPSARILTELRTADCSFFEFALSVSESHRDYFNTIESLSSERQAVLETEALDSIKRQQAVEAADCLSLEEYLDAYFAAD